MFWLLLCNELLQSSGFWAITTIYFPYESVSWPGSATQFQLGLTHVFAVRQTEAGLAPACWRLPCSHIWCPGWEDTDRRGWSIWGPGASLTFCVVSLHGGPESLEFSWRFPERVSREKPANTHRLFRLSTGSHGVSFCHIPLAEADSRDPPPRFKGREHRPNL